MGDHHNQQNKFRAVLRHKPPRSHYKLHHCPSAQGWSYGKSHQKQANSSGKFRRKNCFPGNMENFKHMLPHVTPSVQTGVLPYCTIMRRIVMTHDIMNWIEKNWKEAILFGLEPQKVYALIQCSFLQKVLLKMKFEPMFLKFVSKWYRRQMSALSTHRHITEQFEIFRGLQQRDYLSSYLFEIQMSPLRKMIAAHIPVCGIQLSTNKLLSTGLHFVDHSLFIATLAVTACG